MYINHDNNDLMNNLITTLDDIGINVKDCVVAGNLDVDLVISKLVQYDLIQDRASIHKESTR